MYKPIKGYEGKYLISDKGEVITEEREVFNGRGFGIRKQKMLKQGTRGKGGLLYKFVSLSDGKTVRHYSVHRLVAEAFIENTHELPEVNHKDHNTFNNCVENLEWCSRQYNNEYSHNKKIAQFLNGEKIADYKSAKAASDATNIGRTSITNALTGRSNYAGGFVWKYCDI